MVTLRTVGWMLRCSQMSYEQDEHRKSWNNEEVIEQEAISDRQ
jgi:hypothetical protein